MNIKQIINKKNIIFLFLICILILNFKMNFLTTREETFSWQITFENFQEDSENLVMSKIYEDAHYTKSKFGLTKSDFIKEKPEEVNGTINVINTAINNKKEIENIKLTPYTSQYGLQGFVFSFLFNKLHIPITVLQTLNCIILSIILVRICYLLYIKYGKIFSFSFYLTFLLSPWIVAFARNLYWVEFTWFLPALLALKLSCNYNRKLIYLPLIFIAVLIKCLCGYEYITTILLFTISFFIIDWFITKDKKLKKQIFFTTLIVGIVSLLSFFTAICLHANLKGDGNIVNGIKMIYNEDVVRRTLKVPGSEKFENLSESFNDIRLTNSLEASIFDTVKMYFSWNTNVILGIEGQYFRIMVFITIVLLIYNYLKKEKNSGRDIIMFIIFLGTTMSWFILGKAHSYVHTHMNYVLWYFGFIQICIYIIIKNAIRILQNIEKIELND